ncbi:hypothetical protein [Dactylosporangium sp. NPDC006015]|uniref:hypothetical protein n=1 Tax=Dactylosporangium sp. NPDC006015 TaxID=3154576 RepID=UPI0033B028BF
MPDRIRDELLAELAGRPLDGRAVAAQLVDVAERGLVTLRWHEQPAGLWAVDVSHTRGPATRIGAADAALLGELFGPEREVSLHRHAAAGAARTLYLRARRSGETAGLWQTVPPAWDQLRGTLATLVVAVTGVVAGAALAEGAATAATAAAIGLPTAAGLYLVVRRLLTGPRLTAQGRAAAAEVLDRAERCRAHGGSLADHVAFGTVRHRPAGAHPPPWVDGLPWCEPSTPQQDTAQQDIAQQDMTHQDTAQQDTANRRAIGAMADRIAAAFRPASRSPDIAGGGGGS